jgi:N-acetylglucosamine kinase-like BadF-type ATPase
VLGFDETTARVKEIVETLTQGEPRSVVAIYIGTAGIFTKDDGPRFAATVSRASGVEKVKCENDVMNVVASATDADRCVAGVCGTGMIVYAKEPRRTVRLGGWGYLLGRGGSGYDIGRDAICAALGGSEGTSAATALASLVERGAGMPLERLVLEVYRREPAFVASFAPLVFEAAAAGDGAARAILEDNVRAFAAALNHAAQAYDCGDTVVVSGGIAANAAFGELLKRELKPALRLVVPSYPQVLGACFNCVRVFGDESYAVRERLVDGYGGHSATSRWRSHR